MEEEAALLSTRNKPAFRVGVGYDSHRFADGRKLILGGVEIPYERGLLGHSDADALLHAIGDAICGAAGLPDIGQLFPDTDQMWKDADSRDLLRRIWEKAREGGWNIENVDAVVIAQKPKLSPHISAMCQSVAVILNIDSERVNLRGKTAEGMGALGAGEGIAVHAVCLLHRDQ
jgi:2-C-methyl-D-erythritol 2,4-cyclodiphosphate synthase